MVKRQNKTEDNVKGQSNIRSLVLLVALAIMAQSPRATASFIINASSPTPGTPASSAVGIPVLDSDGKVIKCNPSMDEIGAVISVGGVPLGELLYKVENDGTEYGSLKTSYSLLSPTAAELPWGENDPFPIKIKYDGRAFAHASYLLVKDGYLGSYVFSLSGWNGTDEIDVYNVFYPGKKDMSGTSHIDFYGAVAVVPEPGTVLAGALLLLPFGANTIRMLRRNRAA